MPTYNHSIVIVDDDISVCETIKIALSDLFPVTFFTEIVSFKKFLATSPQISILILDYKINKVNGIEFYKKELATKNIPTILISGFIGQNKTEEEFAELQKYFAKILEKPFDIFELIQFIEKTLKI